MAAGCPSTRVEKSPLLSRDVRIRRNKVLKHNYIVHRAGCEASAWSANDAATLLIAWNRSGKPRPYRFAAVCVACTLMNFSTGPEIESSAVPMAWSTLIQRTSAVVLDAGGPLQVEGKAAFGHCRMCHGIPKSLVGRGQYPKDLRVATAI
jgi:hypothetical protein